MRLRLGVLALNLAALGFADTLTLRNGQILNGDYVGGDARHIKFAVGDRVDTYSVDEVESLRFRLGDRLTSDAPPPPRDYSRDDSRDARDNSAAPPDRGGFTRQASQPPDGTAGLQIPSGTPITVRMIDRVDSDSEHTRLGQTFRASVDEPVLVNGQTVIVRGADATVKLVEDKESGKFEGKTVLTLALMQVMVNGRMIDATTSDVTKESASRGAKTAKVVGGATALGAIIGALAGGGKGAAIGAASGAAVGGTAQVVTKGQVVKIPPETRLTFSLQQPVQL
jgi:hypothetical protein